MLRWGKVECHSLPSYAWAREICYGLNCAPLKNVYVDVLIPSTSECDLVWTQGLQRGD